MSFEESVTTYRSVYFHFLDGLLNTISNGNLGGVLNTLKDIAAINLYQMNHANINFYPKIDEFIGINFFSEDFNESKIEFIINYELNQMSAFSSGSSSQSKNDFRTITQKITSDTEHVKFLEPNDLKSDNFNYCIISIGFNKHQTTTIIFKKGSKLPSVYSLHIHQKYHRSSE